MSAASIQQAGRRESRAQAMILAAGRGERMRPLTDTCPKPLLEVAGKPLMQYHLEALARAGFTDVVVNTAWLGEQIEERFGLQPAWDGPDPLSKSERTRIHYSHEGRDFGGALETAGGIARALPLLDEVFWVVAGDVFAPDFQFAKAAFGHFSAGDKLGHIWLVPNPTHNLKGDFGIAANGLALNGAEVRHTFSTIGLYRRALFEPPYNAIPTGNPSGLKAPLASLLRAAMDNQQITAELYTGRWTDVGTPERLAQLNSS